MREPGPRESRRTRRRTEMVVAAVDAVRRHGAGVSVADIAAAAGITKPVIYRYFTDRADLQRAVGELAARTLVERISAQMRRDLGPAQRVHHMISTFLECIDDDPELWRFVVHQSTARGGTGGPEAGVVADTRHRIALMLAGLLGEQHGQAAEGVAVWAFGVVGMVQSAGDWWLERRTVSREVLTDHLAALAWGGIAGAATTIEPGATTPDRSTRGAP